MDQMIARGREAEARQAAEAAERAKRPPPRIGMSKRQVIERTSWGAPDSVNMTQTARGMREQWVYGLGMYLYFDNGILTGIQATVKPGS